jgi:hypothetical protein
MFTSEQNGAGEPLQARIRPPTETREVPCEVVRPGVKDARHDAQNRR